MRIVRGEHGEVHGGVSEEATFDGEAEGRAWFPVEGLVKNA